MGLLMTSIIPVNGDLAPWRVINDGVMGGVSSGRLAFDEDKLVFSGELSLDNNGGFASVRRLVDQDLSGADSVTIVVRGDGRRYQFRLRMNDRFDGVAWVSEFDTAANWQTVTLELSNFNPQFRGRRVSDAPDLIGADIRQIGFLLADKDEG
ncbi:MAG: CIA30 family protein, partial [Gammaproteobacteria bacterium]|nr:CIA30 family protein [Gammaproteobacteria bacterium]